MQLQTMKDLYLSELRDLYDAEKQIIAGLPKMAQAASSPDLRNAFNEHLQQTQVHVERLDRIFSQMGADPSGRRCTGVAGVFAEGDELMKSKGQPDVCDAGLIAEAQKVEHYEIAGYGTVCAWAKLLGETEAYQILEQTLQEEGQTDKKLTALAERTINKEAVQAH
jgi:ferritin-like metal-binding protein YciE